MPDTKPYLTFDDQGVCSACRAHELKEERLEGIPWKERQAEFEQIIKETKSKKAPFYDALVPVSGGKDSLTQVHRLLEHDLRILAVNVDYGIKTEIGMYNLNLIPRMGANLMTYRPSQPLHKSLIRMGLEDFGDPDLLSHTLLHAYPLHVGLQFTIPLVLLGENSAFEYGGERGLANLKSINRSWFNKFAANSGKGPQYISERYGIPMNNLRVYDFPDELEGSLTTRAVFMSYYFYWDSAEHLAIARQHGFTTLGHHSEGTYRDYVGIDEKINRIHQYLKVLKFGYGRATDHACEDIRNGRLTRRVAKNLVREYDLQDLSDYYVSDFKEYLGYEGDEFTCILEQFRNAEIWKKDRTGTWYIPGYLED